MGKAQVKWQRRMKAEGRCVNCGRERDRVDRTRCGRCRERYSVRKVKG